MDEIVIDGKPVLQRLLTVQEVAEIFQMDPAWVRRKLIGEGIVRASKVGGRFFVRPEDLEKVLQEKEVTRD